MRPSQNAMAVNMQAFVRLPNAVARDKCLSAAALVLLGYRATFAGNFAVSSAMLAKNPIVRGPGFGRDVIARGIGSIVDAGYLRRWQPSSTGDRSFGPCMERLTLPPCGASGKAGRMVLRKWFDAKLSLQEMAAYLFVRAGTGRGRGVYARELAERFGWSRPTAAKVNRALIEFGLLAKRETRTAGRIFGITYEALEPALWHAEPLSTNQGTSHQGARIQCTNGSFAYPFTHLLRRNPLHVRLARVTLRRLCQRKRHPWFAELAGTSHF